MFLRGYSKSRQIKLQMLKASTVFYQTFTSEKCRPWEIYRSMSDVYVEGCFSPKDIYNIAEYDLVNTCLNRKQKQSIARKHTVLQYRKTYGRSDE